MYKLLAADLDGTLVNEEKIITPRTFESLGHLDRTSRGGRTPSGGATADEGLWWLSHQLQRRFGVRLRHERRHFLPTDKYRPAAPSAPAGRRAQLRLRCLSADPSAHHRRLQPIRAVFRAQQPSASARGRRFSRGSPGAVLQRPAGDPNIMPALRDALTEELRGQMDFCLSETFFLECLAPGISKMKGLEAVAGHMNVKREEIIAFGDSDNDVSMIHWAGLGVAMDNAKENARRAADLITASNEEDGIAAVVEQYVL